MCKMNVVVNRVMLGNRELGWEVWNGRCIEEYTSRQLTDMIMGGRDKVYGLRIGRSGELEADRENFFTTSIMEHRHIGNYRSMESESSVNMSYICWGVERRKGENVYKCISNKFEQAVLSEEEIKAYLALGVLTGGVRLKDGKVEAAVMETVDKKAEPERKEPVKVMHETVAGDAKGNKPDTKPEPSKKNEQKADTAAAKKAPAGKEGD